MSLNVNEWKVKYENTILGQVLSFMKTLDQTKILSKSLDGTLHMQIIGDAIPKASIEIFSTLEEKDLFEQVNSSGAMITVTYRGIDYYGYIDGNVSWKVVVPYEYYTASITLYIAREVQ